MMPIAIDRDLLIGLGVALAVGLLIGVEREQRRVTHPNLVAGVRTFALLSLSGALCSLLGVAMLTAGALFVAAAALISYIRIRTDDPGLTTEVSMFAVYVLGALALQAPVLTAALAVAVALLLAMKTHLHAFSRELLSAEELRDGLLLIASALIVLPLLPDHAVDPYGVLNPFKVWRVVVLVMAINALGYVAQRMLGARLGLPISGFVGGFVSSTATIGAMGQRAKAHPDQRRSCVAAAAVSNVATIIQMGLVLIALAPNLFQHLSRPMLIAGLATLLAAAMTGLHAWREPAGEGAAMRGRPFELKQALLFAALVTGILFTSALLVRWFGDKGVMLAAGFAGFADVHAAAASVAQMLFAEQISLDQAEWAVLIGLVCNTVSKTVVAFATGGRAFAWMLMPILIALLLSFSLTIWLW
ncbi:hypothetical protein C7S18_03920 [Ahniella affigens]|uniref:Uncharacterized protein n=1 Tax=Ahniella affigens TaxID=2021234 RepID=A0A2P1PNG0_9GAMM|nr:MgtC/SapB family protein [Ahniella affigens]AVP96390.1 hypothetical protein C7S18_03920 [Ahniella affigens]